jgi:hypothetical protein
MNNLYLIEVRGKDAVYFPVKWKYLVVASSLTEALLIASQVVYMFEGALVSEFIILSVEISSNISLYQKCKAGEECQATGLEPQEPDVTP